MFPDRYSQIFGLGERLGCILNLSHSFDAIEAYFEFASMSITLAPSSARDEHAVEADQPARHRRVIKRETYPTAA